MPAESDNSTSSSSTFLRYGANVMQYQADLCKQQSKVMNIQASMIEQEERARHALMTPYYTQNRPCVLTMPSRTPCTDYTSGTGAYINSKQGIASRQKRTTHNQSLQHQDQRQDEMQGPNIQLRNAGLPSNAINYQGRSFDEKECFGQDNRTEPLDERIEQENLKKDLDSMFDEVLHNVNPSFDSKIFQSHIFKEAEDLLSNSPFNNLLLSLSQDMKQQQTRFTGTIPEEILLNERALKMDKKKRQTENIQVCVYQLCF